MKNLTNNRNSYIIESYREFGNNAIKLNNVSMIQNQLSYVDFCSIHSLYFFDYILQVLLDLDLYLEEVDNPKNYSSLAIALRGFLKRSKKVVLRKPKDFNLLIADQIKCNLKLYRSIYNREKDKKPKGDKKEYLKTIFEFWDKKLQRIIASKEIFDFEMYQKIDFIDSNDAIKFFSDINKKETLIFTGCDFTKLIPNRTKEKKSREFYAKLKKHMLEGDD